MSAAPETRKFEAEVAQVLHLVTHSLYSHKEIFLRELVSNASDACDKLRFEAIGNPELFAGDTDLHIDISVDAQARTLTISDNGIGMSRDEVIANIGTIASSGTRKFLEAMSVEQKADANLIGQFGVGFYSAFVVADRVTLVTRKAGANGAEGVRWESAGTGEYSLETVDAPRGTSVTLHLKADEDEFLQGWQLRSLVARYSDHIGFPIRMRAEKSDKDEAEGDFEIVNQASALWTKAKNDLTDEDYQGFYKHIAHDYSDALAWTHNRVEGNQNFTSLLYIPSKSPFDLMMGARDERKGLRLYVKRVFIMDAAEQLLPAYLRFVRGVVDSDDLPLNVSREILQQNRNLDKLKAISGVTPKAYAQAHRAARVREELARTPRVTDAIYNAGFNSNARFYENADAMLGMTPSAFRKGGAEAAMRFAVGECSLGSVLVARSERGICAILLGDDPHALVRDLQDRFPKAALSGGDKTFEKLVARVVGLVEAPQRGLDLPLDVRGTAFQQRVWKALLRIPAGNTASYAEIAAAIGAPKSARAVAQACAANELAIAIPCHRVVRSDGALSGYRWGVERKRKLLARERR